ncbi:universal stress protein UspA [Shewanella psychropiezotolerans]|uniref:Universal stress protein UspA n=1 Tax=Shewanella psychropiezotolerans TaxID=2593655 RepID=A0ABX5X329_9GAMM|nr:MULTISPECIES: universal stress protein [Shewanella]MPY26724.1 universal stress protein UspA [Shewanella sp. YLB-07]QDO83676.1 universal stress protein UspA [Shewanella psychropiezotolerans]
MDKLFIISQRNQQQTDAISAGILLANQLGLLPEIMAYSYESFSGDAYYNPRIAGAARVQILADDKTRVQLLLGELDANDVPFTNIWCKTLSEHACEHVHPDEYAMMLKSIHESAHFLPMDWQLIRHTKVPLMLLSNNPLNRTKSILMAVDLGSNKPSKQALNQAVITQAHKLAASTGHDLHLGFVIRLPKILRDMDLVNSRTLIKDAYQQHRQVIEEIGLDKNHVHIMAGDADMCLFELSCRLKAQYLVIGARQRQGLLGHVIGNTAESILARIRSNVLVVPHHDENQ